MFLNRTAASLLPMQLLVRETNPCKAHHGVLGHSAVPVALSPAVHYEIILVIMLLSPLT